MGYTSYKTKTNKTKTQHRKQRVNLVLTVQRNWLHGIHKLQDEDKQNKNTTQKTESQSSIDNTEKLATWDTQVTRRRQTKQKHNIENRESIQYYNTEKLGIHKLQDEDKQNKNTTQKTESQSRIDNTEKLDTWIQDEMGYTSYKTKTNKTKTQHRKQRVNLVLTIQRNWLHGIHKLQDEDKQNKNTTQKTESQSSIDNTEKLATWDTQVTRRRQTKQKHNIENRESIQY